MAAAQAAASRRLGAVCAADVALEPDLAHDFVVASVAVGDAVERLMELDDIAAS